MQCRVQQRRMLGQMIPLRPINNQPELYRRRGCDGGIWPRSLVKRACSLAVAESINTAACSFDILSKVTARNTNHDATASWRIARRWSQSGHAPRSSNTCEWAPRSEFTDFVSFPESRTVGVQCLSSWPPNSCPSKHSCGWISTRSCHLSRGEHSPEGPAPLSLDIGAGKCHVAGYAAVWRKGILDQLVHVWAVFCLTSFDHSCTNWTLTRSIRSFHSTRSLAEEISQIQMQM